MILFIEAIFIGIFSLLLSIPFLFLFKDYFIIQLGFVGFIKHFLSYFIGIQDYYCNLYLKSNNYKSISSNIIFECLFEAIIYIYFGLLLSKIIYNKFILFFFLGFIIHIFADYFGIHSLFLLYNCKSI